MVEMSQVSHVSHDFALPGFWPLSVLKALTIMARCPLTGFLVTRSSVDIVLIASLRVTFCLFKARREVYASSGQQFNFGSALKRRSPGHGRSVDLSKSRRVPMLLNKNRNAKRNDTGLITLVTDYSLLFLCTRTVRKLSHLYLCSRGSLRSSVLVLKQRCDTTFSDDPLVWYS
jgi:hypothetical protein